MFHLPSEVTGIAKKSLFDPGFPGHLLGGEGGGAGWRIASLLPSDEPDDSRFWTLQASFSAKSSPVYFDITAALLPSSDLAKRTSRDRNQPRSSHFQWAKNWRQLRVLGDAAGR